MIGFSPPPHSSNPILDVLLAFRLPFPVLNIFMIFQEEPSVESPAPSHKCIAALESTASSKEADQPSPVSVLEPVFGDDLSSSSECFESVSADLQGSFYLY